MDEYYIFIMLWIEFWVKVVMWSVIVVDWIKGGLYLGEFGKDDVVEFFKCICEDFSCVYNGEFGYVCYLFVRKFLFESLEFLFVFD